ncbi:MAG: TlpA family protein disulfide reductase [Fimbriimonas ginsengisoli]|uniref:TlpA family protein disulfide reductase n=1 Tax=Fimbriimonas ginsengisoli TaxID=1005039 RepID=A0A931LUN9_FIMGI|nr:TlpA family protein disulfide reductase [Fimbriimonas ginsengisoli]
MELGVGKRFRDFVLGDFDSETARKGHPLAVIVWKATCPVCRLALPFFDRLQAAYPAAAVVGVGQEPAEEVDRFAAELGLKFKQLSDAELKTSRRLGVAIVPSYWLVSASGDVLVSGEGWDRAKVEDVGKRLALATGTAEQTIVTDADGVPAYRPG